MMNNNRDNHKNINLSFIFRLKKSSLTKIIFVLPYSRLEKKRQCIKNKTTPKNHTISTK